MACPTCSHTMQGLGHNIFACPRCGTVRNDGCTVVPSLVHRCREFADSTFDQPEKNLAMWLSLSAWKRLGIAESIDLPEYLRETT